MTHMPSSRSLVSGREMFSAFVSDDHAINALYQICSEFGWSSDVVYPGGLHNAVQTLAVSSSPSILFVDISQAQNPLSDINSLAEVCEPGTIVIACGHLNDVRLYRDLLASGIQDYLLMPLNPDQLRDAFAHAQALLNQPKPETMSDQSPVALGVLGVRGGCGATSFATGLAWSLAAQEGRLTALLDLDLHFGTGALQLDLEPGRCHAHAHRAAPTRRRHALPEPRHALAAVGHPDLARPGAPRPWRDDSRAVPGPHRAPRTQGAGAGG